MTVEQKPITSISVTFQQPWLVRIPFVYRYLDKKYVDSFFETGKLRLSTFKKFSQHADEERNDSTEGYAVVSAQSSNREGGYIGGSIGLGQSSYILCGSTVLDNSIARNFDTNSGFIINDTVNFSAAIARAIPSFVAGAQGSCMYQERRSVHRNAKFDLDSHRISPESNHLNMGKMFETLSQHAGDDPMFLKHIKYQNQHEYRFIWHASYLLDDYLNIECPDARQFCSRFPVQETTN